MSNAMSPGGFLHAWIGAMLVLWLVIACIGFWIDYENPHGPDNDLHW